MLKLDGIVVSGAYIRGCRNQLHSLMSRCCAVGNFLRIYFSLSQRTEPWVSQASDLEPQNDLSHRRPLSPQPPHPYTAAAPSPPPPPHMVLSLRSPEVLCRLSRPVVPQRLAC